MKKRKVAPKTKSSPKKTRKSSHSSYDVATEHDFIIILGGGFVVLLLTFFFFTLF